MAPVARTLPVSCGVLEPFQAGLSVGGQVRELADFLRESGDPPIAVIGFSWGAFLGFLLAARYPSLVRRLVLVGSPPFEERSAAAIRTTRLGRLAPQEREEACVLEQQLLETAGVGSDAALARYGALMERADAFDPVGPTMPAARCRYDIFRHVWSEAEGMRRSGALLAEGLAIRCPVTAIHGDYDPHPAEGVREPLARMLPDFRFILLERCGHRPWTERQAKDRFFSILEREIEGSGRD